MAPVTGLQRTSDRLSIRLACALLGVALLLGCGDSGSDGSTAANTLSGAIRIDGSSTVYPVSTVAAEYFGDEHPRVRISVGRSGTSAGMNKFLEGEIDICDASRPITESEILTAQQKGIGFVEFAVAQDGMAVVVNKENDWCDVITVDELKAIWRPEAADTIKNWSQVNDGWPDEPLKLFGPGTASGTFEHFTEAIVGDKKASRPDYSPSEDDNMSVRGVIGERGGMAYFGYAYYAEYQDKLKLVGVEGGDGPVKPSEETVRDGSYAPLSRHVFIYVNDESLRRPEVREFVKYYLKNADRIAKEALYFAVDEETAKDNQKRLSQFLTSSDGA